MTPSEIALFIGRLMRRELARGELSALTTRDLDAINHYLTERAKLRQVARQRVADCDLGERVRRDGLPKDEPLKDEPPKNRVPARGAQRTYSEQEILAEFGLD